MADFVFSPLVKHLVSHALEKIEEEVKLVKNVKQDVENLKMRLVSIQALLEDAERKQIDSEIIKLWLSKLEETSFRVDNVLDGWNSDILKAQIKKEQEEDDPNKKVCLPVLSSCFCFKPVLKQVLDHREIAKIVQDLNKELDAILKGSSELGVVATAVGQSQQQKAKEIHGRKLTTSLVDDNSDPQHQITILEALKPHPFLETLSILSYKGHPTCSPKWLTSLAHLKRLTLGYCVHCEIFPPLGKLLPSLESLCIWGWKSVKKVGHELLGIEEGKRKDPSQSSFVSFPKLEELIFGCMDEWKEWEGSIPEDGSLQVMPSLRSLEFYSCKKLEGLPDFLRMIRLPTLSIWSCEILEQVCQKGTGKEWLKISHIPNIHIDRKYVQRDGIWVGN